jgi:hypothetical protein
MDGGEGMMSFLCHASMTENDSASAPKAESNAANTVGIKT